ncbi:MAG: alpha-L-rhamnosidase C-terminal domain-containing protein, partial [Bacteroidota bacterium]
ETGFASHDRSDCHAWAAHPAFYHLQLIAGIRSADIGFEEVLIAPNLGDLTELQADMPHPKGRIAVDYKMRRGKLTGTVTLPPGLEGSFEYDGKQQTLTAGVNKLK